MRRIFSRVSRAQPDERSIEPFVDRATRGDVLHAFRLLLGRHPNPDEVVGHMLQVGRPLADVARVYLGSREFAARGLMEADAGEVVRVDCPAGFAMFVRPTDIAVGAAIAAGGSYEPHVTAVFERRVKPGMRVIDIGANIGWFTMLAASRVGTEGHVLAVEPDRDNASLLEASRRANAFAHVTLLPVAAGRESGAVAIYKSYSNAATAPLQTIDPLRSTIVPAIRLDDIVGRDGRPVGLIKADVEGAEPLALGGLERTIRRDRPVVICEFSPGMMGGVSGVNGRQYAEWLATLGYRIAVIAADGSERACVDADAALAAHIQSGVDHIDLVCDPI